MRSIKLDKKAIVALIIYGVCFVEILVVIPFQFSKLSSSRHKLSDLKKKITQAKKGLSSRDRLTKSKEKTKLDIADLESSLGTSQDISSVLAFISRKAKENNIDIVEINQSSPELYKKISDIKIYSLPIIVEAKAGFHNLGQYLNILQGGFYLLKIKSFSIEEAKEENVPYGKVKLSIGVLFRE